MATGTIDPTQVKQLVDALNGLTKALGGSASSYSGGGSTGYASYKNDNGGVNTDAVRNAMKNNGDFAQQLGNMLKKVSLSAKGLDKVFDNLEKMTRDQSDAQRKATLSLVGMLKRSDDFAKTLDKLNEKAAKAATSIDAHKKTVDALKDTTAKINSLEEQRLKVEERLEQARKSKKKSSNINDELQLIVKSIQKEKEEVDNLTKKYKEMNDTFTELNETTGLLNDADLEYLKNVKDINTENEDYAAIVAKLKKSTANLNTANQVIAKSLVATAERNAKNFEDGVKSLKTSMVKAGKLLFTEAIPAAFKDYMNRLKYNIPESNYGGSLLKGISESDRSELIGNNRQQLRSLGGGNEYNGFDKQLGDLQKTAYQFGVYGKDALETALAYQKTAQSAGVAGSDLQGQKLQMSLMHQFSEQIGVTDGALKDFYDSLGDMGELAVLNQKYADKSDAERSKAINKEIYERTKLNTALGISLDMQKQQQQTAINTRYAGIESLIKTKIGSSIQVDQYNQSNPNNKISGADSKFFSDVTSAGGAPTLNDPKDIARYNMIGQKIAASDEKNLTAAASSAAKGDSGAQFNQAIQTATLGHLNINRQEFDNQFGRANQQRISQGGAAVVGPKDFDAALTDATKQMDGPGGFTNAMINATQAVTGFTKNPIGGAFTSALQTAGGFILGQLGMRAGGAAISAVAGSGAVATGGAMLGAAGTTALAIGGSSVGALAGGGAAGAATIAGGVAIAGAIGYGIGTVINKTLIEGTKTGDAIGSTLVKIAGFFGSQDAQDAVGRMNNYDTSKATTDARMDEMNAVTQAQKLAVQTQGTAGSTDAVNNAETLRNAYKAKYGTDLSGGAVGYQNLSGVASSTYSPAGALAGAIAAAPTGASPSNLINKQVTDQINAELQAGNTDKALELLQQIAKSNKDMNERDGKAEVKATQVEASRGGSTYASLGEHLSKSQKGLTSSVA